MASATVKSGATVCASSDNAEATADQREVLLDNPVHGAGWNMLTRNVDRNVTFTVTVTTGEGINRVSWSNQFKCIRADDNQVHMSRPQAAAMRRSKAR